MTHFFLNSTKKKTVLFLYSVKCIIVLFPSCNPDPGLPPGFVLLTAGSVGMDSRSLLFAAFKYFD